MLEGCSQCCVTFFRIVSITVIRAVLTCISSLVRQYMKTTNRSRFRMISSGMAMTVTKLSAISGNASRFFHADFFPRLVIYDVTSQPVNA